MTRSAGDTAARTFRTVCPRNCYCTCGMLVTVQNGRIVEITGDPLNSATDGKVCLKGISYARRQHDPERLRSPLRRIGNRFEPASWDDIMGQIASGLERIRTESGPRAVLYYEGSGSHGALSVLADAFWNPFGGPTRAHGDLCWPAGLEATRLTYGDNRHNHPIATRQSRLILLWGHNPAETNIHQWRLIIEACRAGARLAVIDPRSTDTTDAADWHLQPLPGTDGPLALAIGQVIVSEGLHDRAFLRDHASGFEAYAERLQAWPPERAADICGIDPEAIRSLARTYGTISPALLIAGFGLQRHTQAGQTMRAVALLPALTGNIGRPGAGWQYANLASHSLQPPPGLPPPPAGVGRSFPTSRLGRNLLELHSPPLRAAWFQMANPASQHPHTGRVRRGLEKLDLLVVVDQYLTDTARLAHFVLPAKTMFEEADLVTAYWHPYLQWREKIFDPIDGIRPETALWHDLCRRFGFSTELFEIDRHRLLAGMLGPGGDQRLERLRCEPLDPSGWGPIAWADGRFATPDGKVAFSSPEAAHLWGTDPVPDWHPPAEGTGTPLSGRFPLHLLTCKTRERIHSQFGNLDWVGEVERPRVLDLNPTDARARGIQEGDLARVFNDRGQVVLPVRLAEGIRPGVVHAIEGRCRSDDPFLNLLTDDGVTDMNHGATFYGCLVQVERA